MAEQYGRSPMLVALEYFRELDRLYRECVMTINRPVPWAIFGPDDKLEFLTMAVSADDVWLGFTSYTLNAADKEVYRDQGYQCVRISVKRFAP